MSTVEDRIVAMTFDNKSFETGVGTTIGSLGNLQKSLGLLSGWTGVKPLVDGVGKMGGAFGNLMPSIGGVSAKMIALGTIGVTALANITNKAIDAGAQLAKSLTIAPIAKGFSEYELQINSTRTILSNVAQSGATIKDVNRNLNELNEYADQTIYNFGQMTDAIGKFTAAGVDLDTATASIKGIANMAALGGASAEDASRAMYQLSQAISAGKIGLQDWKSVENANMATSQFKTALAETAVAMGKLDPAAVKLTGKMKNVTVAGESFRQSISAKPGEESWLTSDVLTSTLEVMTGDLSNAELKARGYTKRQREMLQLTAQMAVDSASQVRTFSGLMDKTKEGIVSGWAESFHIIIGGLNKSIKLWGAVDKVVDGAVSSFSDARNNMLKEWAKNGGRIALLDSFVNMFTILKRLLKPIGRAFRDVFPPLTGERLAELTKNFEKFTESLIPSKKTMAALRSIFGAFFGGVKIGLSIIGGLIRYFFDFAMIVGQIIPPFVRLAGAILNLFNVSGTTTGLADGINSFFDAIIAGRRMIMDPFMDFLASFVDIFVVLLRKGPMAAWDQVLKTFSSLKTFGSAVVAFVKKPFEAIGNLAAKAKSKIGPWISELLDMMGPFGDSLRAIGGSIAKAFGSFKQKLAPVREAFSNLVESAKGVVDKVKAQFANIFSGLGTGGKLGAVTSAFSSMGGVIGSALGKIVDGFAASMGFILDLIAKVSDAMGNLFSSGGSAASTVGGGGAKAMESSLNGVGNAAEFVSRAWNGVLSILKNVGVAVGPTLGAIGGMFGAIGKKLGDFFKDLSIEDIIDLVNSGVILMFINTLRKYLGTVDDFLDVVTGVGQEFQNTTKEFQNTMKGIQSGLKTAQNGVRATTILKIAIAVGILAGSLKLLSTIAQKDLYKGIGAISALGVVITGMMFAMTKMLGKGAIVGITSFGTAIVALSFGIYLLASAVKKLSSISLEGLSKGVGAVSALMIGVGLLGKALSGMGGLGALAAAAAMIGIAFGLTMLAGPVILFSKMDTKKFFKGVGLIAAAIFIIGAASLAMAAALPGALAMIPMAFGLSLLVVPLLAFGKMKGGTIAKSLLMLAGALGVLATGMLAMIPALPGAAALVVAAFGLGVLLPVLFGFSKIKWSSFLKGMLMLAIAMGVFAILGVALIPASVGLLAFGAALVLIGLSLALVGVGLLAAGAGLTMIAVSGAAAFLALKIGFGVLLDMIGMFIDSLGEWGMSLLSIIGKLMGELINVIWGALEKLGEKIIAKQDMLARLLTAIIKIGLKAIRDTDDDWVATGVSLLNAFLDGLIASNKVLAKKGTKLVTGFITGITENLNPVTNSATNLIVKFVSGLGKSAAKIALAGVDAVIAFIMGLAVGIRVRGAAIRSAALALIGAMISALAPGFADLAKWVAGKLGDLKDTIVKGIGDAKDKLTGSPGKPTYDLGQAVGTAIIKGLSEQENGVRNSTRKLADTMAASLRESLGQTVDMDPTIKPVLDLTQLRAEAAKINPMLASSSIKADLTARGAADIFNTRALAQEAAAQQRNEPRSVVFEQTINAPKALSTSDIYRQTKSQINMAREELRV